MLDIATRLGDDDLRFRAHQWLVPDRFQAGLGLVAGHVEQMSAIAEARRNPLQRWWVLVYRGLLTGFAGRDDEAEQLAHDAAALGRRLGQPAADAYRVGQLARVYWTAWAFRARVRHSRGAGAFPGARHAALPARAGGRDGRPPW